MGEWESGGEGGRGARGREGGGEMKGARQEVRAGGRESHSETDKD